MTGSSQHAVRLRRNIVPAVAPLKAAGNVRIDDNDRESHKLSR
jgi:hypothetical protein